MTGWTVIINIPVANSCSPWIYSHVQQINEIMTIYQCDGAKASEQTLQGHVYFHEQIFGTAFIWLTKHNDTYDKSVLRILCNLHFQSVIVWFPYNNIHVCKLLMVNYCINIQMKKLFFKQTHYKLDSLLDLVQACVTSFKILKHFKIY